MSDNIYQGEDFDEKVIRQVEFYFSDSNLQSDKFLWKIYEANDGWVELKTILTFGRMKQYRPEEKVIEALKKSTKLELSANNELIKRTDPLKDFDEVKNTKKKNTVHIEGFPHELNQDQIEAWFGEKVVPSLPKEKDFNSIRMIKTRAKKEFFGVVDVEFKTEEDAKYVVEDVELSYEKGVIPKDEATNIDKKDLLKKMSQLTFQEMRESGKRFGQNEVTKRRNSFNDNKGKGKKYQKGGKGKKNDNRKGSGSEEDAHKKEELAADEKETLNKIDEGNGRGHEEDVEKKKELAADEKETVDKIDEGNGHGHVEDVEKKKELAADEKETLEKLEDKA
ncbi:hypothetical protein PVL30_000805 [Lodderomyces elongisporus]|uniref:uncharacterized protein n=1 Tax=Lodderomyces elongisporus TaxID=36914 RepID=UPI002925D7DC|nr:uncharacterized protein PVL30_000805 [Lodderomyces elongisporus]WLF77096.1 hypothetical protein PVL30_000805 [Lodderomyces elongisporus]